MSFRNKGTVGPTVIVTREPDRSGNFVCDGTADDVQIQAALDFLTAGRTWNEKVVLKGDFSIAATILVPSYTILDASGATLTLVNGVNSEILHVNIENDVEIIGGIYNGNKAANAGNVILFTTCTDSVIRDAYVFAAEAIAIFASRGTRLEIRNNFVSDSERGIYLYKTDLASVVDNWVDDCDDYGIIATTDAEKIHIINNFVVDCLDGQGYGIEVLNAGPYSEIIGNHVDNCNINLYVSDCDYVRVIGNYSTQSGVFGIAVDASDYCVVADNICRLNGRMGIKLLVATYCTVNGNICTNNGTNEDANLRSGIWIDQSNHNTINGNVCTDDQGPKTQTYGIREFDATSDHNIVTSNELIGNLTGGLYLVGLETAAHHNRVDGTNTIAAIVIIPKLFVLIADPDSNVGDHPALVLPDTVDTTFRFQVPIPLEFQELMTAQVVVVQTSTGGPPDMQWSTTTDWGKICAAENYNDGSDAETDQTTAVAQNELVCIDVSASLTGIAAGDLVGFTFIRRASQAGDTIDADAYYMGFRLRYV